jgi:hypothetical protein
MDPEARIPLERFCDKGQDPASNIHLLHRIFGTDSDKDLICAMAGGPLEIPAFMEKKRSLPKQDHSGRPQASVKLLEEVGISTEGIPSWVLMEIQKRFFAGMRAIKREASTQLGAVECAKRALKREFLLGWPNPYFLGQDPDTKQLNQYANSLADKFKHPTTLRTQQEAIALKMQPEWSHWGYYEPVLSDLLPLYFMAYRGGGDASKIWHHLIRHCEMNSAVMSIAKTIILNDEDSCKHLHVRINISLYIEKDGRLVHVANCLRLPSFDQITNMMKEPGARLLLDWAAVFDDRARPEALEFQPSGPANSYTLYRLLRCYLGEHAVKYKGPLPPELDLAQSHGR